MQCMCRSVACIHFLVRNDFTLFSIYIFSFTSYLLACRSACIWNDASRPDENCANIKRPLCYCVFRVALTYISICIASLHLTMNHFTLLHISLYRFFYCPCQYTLEGWSFKCVTIIGFVCHSTYHLCAFYLSFYLSTYKYIICWGFLCIIFLTFPFSLSLHPLSARLSCSPLNATKSMFMTWLKLCDHNWNFSSPRCLTNVITIITSLASMFQFSVLRNCILYLFTEKLLHRFKVIKICNVFSVVVGCLLYIIAFD